LTYKENTDPWQVGCYIWRVGEIFTGFRLLLNAQMLQPTH